MQVFLQSKFFFLTAFISLVLLNSCGSKGGSSGGGTPPNPCSGVTITVSGTVTNATAPGATNGAISTAASGGSGFTFSINSGAFQSSGNFTGLAAGSYTITAKDSRGCTGSNSFTVASNDPCTSSTFTVSGTSIPATPCLSTPNGSITITTSDGGTGFTYNINGGAFQSSPTFNTLAPNTYTVGAKETGGCVKTTSITVTATAAGPLFSAVRTILLANCAISGCHIGSTPTGGINYTQDCEIVVNKDRIKVRAVDNFGVGQQMPPPPSSGLSQADRNAIVNWINAGGLYSN
ncbi:MAG TPA: hypothetical protein VI548_09215 [Chitinophagaceae bacterium]|nr:hypothetical protein [Chitinophagaceae bacterium]